MLGLQYLSKLIEEKDTDSYVKHRLPREVYNGVERELFDEIDGHVRKYGAIPAKGTLEKKLDLDSFMEEADEPAAYYSDELKRRYRAKRLKAMVTQISEHLKADNMNPDKAEDLAKSHLSELQLHTHQESMLDFRTSKDLILTEYKKKMVEGDDYGIRLGWPSFDEMCQGLSGGDLVSIVGRPSLGKTFLLLYSALNAWASNGKRILFVSMEMDATILAQRLIAMYAHVGLTQLKSAQLTKPLMQRLKKGMTEVAGMESPFWVVNGSMKNTTVDDVLMLAQQLKPDLVLVDGAYLLGHKFIHKKGEKVDANAEALKHDLAAGMDIPVIASYQFNREAAKLAKNKTKETAGLEHIGLTDSIGQLSSVVLGLFEDENIETMKRRKVSVLKGRNGETGEFYIHWQFQKMDFSEYDEEAEAKSLQYL